MLDFEKLGGAYVPYEEMADMMRKGLPAELVTWVLDKSHVVDVGPVRFVERKSVERIVKEELSGKKDNDRKAKAEAPAKKGRPPKDRTSEIKKLEAAVNEKEAEIRRKEEEIASKSDAIRRLEDDIKTYEELLEQAASEAESRHDEDKVEDVYAELNKVQKEYSDIMVELGKRNVDCTELERAVKGLNEKLDEADRKLDKEKNAHANTKKQLAEAKKRLETAATRTSVKVMGVPDDDGLPTSKAGLRKSLKDAQDDYRSLSAEYKKLQLELDDAKKELEDIRNSMSSKNMTDILKEKQALAELVETRNREIKALEDDRTLLRSTVKELNNILSKSKTEIQNLRSSLGKSRAKAAERNVFAGIMEMYSGEIMDYIGMLARMRLESLPVDKNGAYMRERDLCEGLSKACPDSGYQNTLAKSIEDAVKQKFEKGSDAGLKSLGFNCIASDNHDKYALEGYNSDIESRYVLVFPKTSSDCKARDAATSFMKRMLGFDGKPVSGEGKN